MTEHISSSEEAVTSHDLEMKISAIEQLFEDLMTQERWPTEGIAQLRKMILSLDERLTTRANTVDPQTTEGQAVFAVRLRLDAIEDRAIDANFYKIQPTME